MIPAAILNEKNEQIRDLKILHAFSLKLLDYSDCIDEVLWELAHDAVAHIGLEDCVIYVLDEASGDLVQRAAFGPKNPDQRSIFNPIRLQIGQGIVGACALEQRPIIIKDTRTDTRYIVDDQDRRSELAVPIFSMGKLIGVIDSEHSNPDFFTSWHIEIFTTLGAMTAGRITAAKLEQSRLQLANRDHLTGLLNRTLLSDCINQAAARALVSQSFTGLLFLDIDHFKLINDGHSHAMGDQILLAVAKRLQKAIRPQDAVARFGGDEFIVVVDQVESFSILENLAHDLQACLSAPIKIGNREFQISLSIGISLHQGAQVDPEALIQEADMAMYTAKSAGRARIIAFDRRIRERIERRTLMAHHLNRAVEQRTIRPAFQQIVDLRSRRLAGYESLARWTDNTLGAVSPAEFVPLAEELGIINRLGASILERSLAEAGRLGGDWRISVNLSPLQLEEPSVIDKIEDALEYSGVAPARLCLEITESAIIKQPDKAIRIMEDLRALGIRLAIDDFGTGYSSLSMLRKLPVHSLKVDRSFIKEITRSHADLQLVRAIIGIAQDFGLDVTAEGVESEEQAALLAALGCTNGQGYLFGRPASLLDAPSGSIEPCRAAG